jgi:hypothetical protein
MTVAATIACLLPIILGSATGSEVMRNVCMVFGRYLHNGNGWHAPGFLHS